jgi:hypothetical protein
MFEAWLALMPGLPSGAYNVHLPGTSSPRIPFCQVFNVVVGLSGLSDPSIKDGPLQTYALQARSRPRGRPGVPEDSAHAPAPEEEAWRGAGRSA